MRLLRFILRRVIGFLRLWIWLAGMASQPQEESQADLHPSEPSVPVSFPIKDLDYLESRSYFQSFHYPFNVASVPLPPHAQSALPFRRRLLVCHDMAGGYGDDRFVQGGENPNAYAIWHWHLIDVFVYFSHDLVTIPPPCWTNAAHRHGVKVLGTFITEWDKGRFFANKLLATESSAKMYAESLAELAVKLGFDGWLINMEVELSREQVPILEEFVAHLTQTLHKVIPWSLVIWYDSVTKDGQLLWQNQLNQNNKTFFDSCDGIFVNYTWKPDYPGISATYAGERPFDVYMGIDVFGRGTFAGGEWNVNAALDLLKNESVSAALFAPGWLYETQQPPSFETAQNRWWSLIENSWGLVQHYPRTLPFYSNFNQGRGYHFSVEGLQVDSGYWNNISCQQFQPILDSGANNRNTPIQAFTELKGESYDGGTSIRFMGHLNSNAIMLTRIFVGMLMLEDLPIHVSYSVRSDGNSMLGLCLWFSSNFDRERTIVLIADQEIESLPDLYDEIIHPKQIIDARTVDKEQQTWFSYEADIQKNGCILTQMKVVCYKGKSPSADNHSLLQSRKLLEGNITSDSPLTFDASLGHIGICYSEYSPVFPPAYMWILESQNVKWGSNSDGTRIISLKLTWSINAGQTSFLAGFNIYFERVAKFLENEHLGAGSAGGGMIFLGTTLLQMYYVSDLAVPPGITGLRFTIQAYDHSGAYQKLDSCAQLELVTN